MSRKGALLPSFFRKGRESMKKKLSLCIAAALGAAVLFGGNAEAAKVSFGSLGLYDNENNIGVLLHGENLVDGENIQVDKDLRDVKVENQATSFFANPTIYGVWATDNAILSSDDENISVSASAKDANLYVTAVGADIGKGAINDTDYTDGGTVLLGKAGVTKNISLTAISNGKDAVGLSAIRNPKEEDSGNPAKPARIEVNGENLFIKADSVNGTAVGVWVQNNTGGADKSRVTINTENTTMNLTGKSTTGFNVMSGGIAEVNSNLEVHADNIIVTRGNSIININTDGQHSTKLYGDVNFNYDYVTSQTVIDSQVNINLTGADSIWEGNTRFSWTSKDGNRPTNEDLAVNSMHLTIADGAQWTPNAVPVEEGELHYGGNAPDYGADDYVETNQVTLNDGIINIKGSAVQDGKHTGITIGNLNGTGGTINLESDDQFTTRELNIKAAGPADGETQSSPTKLTVNFTGINADDISTDKTKQQEQLNKLAGHVKFGTGIDEEQMTATANVGEGLITGAISAGMKTNDATGGSSIIADSIHQNSSTTTMENMKNIAAVSIAAWRQEDSTLSQRLGDLRETTGGQGIWARVSRGEFEYSGEFKNQYNYFQIGWDMAKDDWHYGAAVSYNDGETTYSDGNGENSSTSLSLYGTRLLNDGQYFDIVLKAGRLNNKYDNYAAAGHTHGDYDAWGTEISGEYGKKIDLANDWFVTPQAQLSLMRIGSEDYTTSNGIHVDQDTLYSAVGRIGAEAGKKTAWGSLYAKASVLHDFAGDADTYLTYRGLSNSYMSNSYSQDIGDTWYEAGFGANWKMSDSSYLYVDVIRTFGGDIKTPWQWNAGVRWGF